MADGGQSLRKILDPVSEPFRPEMNNYETSRDIGVHELWQLQAARTVQQKKYLDRWNAAGLDAIICRF